MRKLKVCLAVLIIAMMMGGSAWAFNAVDHVKVAPNGKGDLLMFPYYFAYPGGYSSKITVINTSSTHSVVAKVVYRSFNWSEEVKDHLLYLSPNDVWTGTLVNVNGIARLQSQDDSMLGKSPSGIAADSDFANLTPVDEPLGPVSCTDDANTMGYIQVFESASREESKATTGYEPGQRVAKRHIYDWYHSDMVSIATIQNGPYSPVNVLTGYQENSFGWGYTLKQANVFADYFNFYKLVVGQQTYFGDFANNSVAEVEAAIGKQAISLPYIAKANGDSSVHIFNFPTKESRRNLSSTCSYYMVNPFSPYWTLVNSKCETYSLNIYDLSENTPSSAGCIFSPCKTPESQKMCGEVEFNIQGASNPAYSEGWIRYSHGKAAVTKNGETASRAPISYTGIPVLVSVLFWSVERDNPAEANAAYTDGVVRVANAIVPYYQYSE